MWLNLSHVIGGFGDRSREIRKEETDRADKAFELERKSLEWLSQSDDPEIRTAAITGILQLSQPKRKGGLSGWFGEVEQHPAYANIRKLIDTPVTKTRTTPTPEGGKPMVRMGTGGSAGTPVDNPEFGPGGPFGPGAEHAAPGRMAALTGAGSPGSPLLAEEDTGYHPPGDTTHITSTYAEPPNMETGRQAGLPQPGAGGGGLGLSSLMGDTGPAPPSRSRGEQVGRVPYDIGHQESYSAPREVFYGPEERIRRQYSAQYGGRIQGIIQGAREAGVELSPDQIEEIVLAQSGSPSRRARYNEKFVQFRDGTTGTVSYNGLTGTWEDGMGNPVDANDIVRELPRTAAGQTYTVTRDIETPQGPRTVTYTVDRATGKIIGQSELGEPTQTTGTVTIPGQGTYTVDKGTSKGTRVEGVPPGPVSGGGSTVERLDPYLVAAAKQLEDDADAVDAAVIAAMRQTYSPNQAKAVRERTREEEAQKRGYGSYADLIAKRDAARKAVSTRPGAGGAAAGTPAGAGGVAGEPGVSSPPSVPAPAQAPAPAPSPGAVSPSVTGQGVPGVPTTPAPPAGPAPGGFGTPQGADAIRRRLPPR